MSESTQPSMKLVPAACPKCGGQLEVDPTQEAAVCKYCGTPFIVDKAIQNYNIANAHIDHVDKVTVDMKGSVDSVVGLIERQMDKSRESRKEDKKIEAENQKEFFKNFWKFFLLAIVVAVVAWILMNSLGAFK